MKRRIGIYSGSFDPIHQGHIAFADEARKICDLDEIIFLPEQAPRDKPNVTKIDVRVALIKRVIATRPRLSVLSLRTPQFTVAATLPILQAQLPGSELTLLIGSDVVRTFEYRWKDLAILLRTVSLAIGMRGDDEPADIKSILSTLEKDLNVMINYKLIHTDHAHTASSYIRKSRII